MMIHLDLYLSFYDNSSEKSKLRLVIVQHVSLCKLLL